MGWPGVFFLFPIIFFAVLFYTRFKNRPERLYLLLGLTLVIGGWIYVGLVFNADPLGIVSHRSEPAQHFRRGGVRLQPRRVPHRARSGHGHQDARLYRGGADARRNARGT